MDHFLDRKIKQIFVLSDLTKNFQINPETEIDDGIEINVLLTWCVEDDDEDAENEERPLLLFGESVNVNKVPLTLTLFSRNFFNFKKVSVVYPIKVKPLEAGVPEQEAV